MYHDHIVYYRALLGASRVMADELRIIHLNKFLGDTYNFHVRNITEQFPLDGNYPDRGLPSVYRDDVDSPAPSYLHLPERLKKSQCVDKSTDSVFLIETSRNAYRDRFEIRRTMGRHDRLNNFFFFIGTGRVDSFDAALADEIATYDDIVVGSFEDTYENLPTKTKLVYKIAVEQCDERVDSYYMIDSDVLLGLIWL